MWEGLTVVVPLNEAKLFPVLTLASLSLIQTSQLREAHLAREADDLLKSPIIIDTTRPASLSVAAQRSAV